MDASSIKHGILLSYDILKYLGFDNPIILALSTSTILLYIVIKIIFFIRDRNIIQITVK